MMMVDGSFRVALVTAHVPLRDVPQYVKRDRVLRKLSVLGHSLRTDFGIRTPSIAVLGLNPHAGENGLLGDEEGKEIEPAVAAALDGSGMQVDGPFPADAFFGTRRHRQYDAVLGMYHDQALIPFKALAFDRGVNFTAGLPVVRTSPDHGTAFDIAGQDRASAGSMKAAIELAVATVRNRWNQPA